MLGAKLFKRDYLKNKEFLKINLYSQKLFKKNNKKKFNIFYEKNVHCFFTQLFFHKTIPKMHIVFLPNLCFYIAITAPKMMRGQLAWGANCRGIADLHYI